MNKQSELYFLKLVQDACENLDKIDDLIESNGKRLQQVDFEISDMLHLIESNDILEENAYAITSKLKDLREERRSLLKEYELGNTYIKVKNKIPYKPSRTFIGTELMKTLKQFSKDYKDRVLTDEEKQQYLTQSKAIKKEIEQKENKVEEATPKKRHRAVSSDMIERENKIIELYKKGYKQKDIVNELHIQQPWLSVKLKKLKEEGRL